MTRTTMIGVALVLMGLVAGCGADSGPQGGDAVNDMADDTGGDALSPSGCPALEVPADWTYPAGPYGGQVGDRMADITLDDCDGNPVRLGDLVGGSDLVLFNVSAGWCPPCVQETKTMETDVHQAFCKRGLRVFQVLFEDDLGNPATKLFCKQWRDRFGLTLPVVIDPLFKVKELFTGDVGGQTPLNLLVDHDGVIKFRSAGPPPTDFTDRIDGLLPK
ncbi:MAG: redoxin domain-containing protein [Deltaproteobacteria bacterium]|nr:redoxin domain-containing protein [Deltaproteobacteria bacterium]